jgi:uncharacterized protein (TIGR00375 family)
MHIHIGGTMSGKPVKITASRQMTLTRILEESSERKGMEMIGVIDAHVTEVQEELEDLIKRGFAVPHPDGGILYKQTMLILGCEVEIREEGRGEAHFLCYLPDLARMKRFTAWLSARCRNVHLSSQRVATTLRELQSVVDSLDGTVVPAHIFTPHKGLYGSCTDSLEEVADAGLILAVELGLSANTAMADQLSELRGKTFLTNSDAHSLGKIGREYQRIAMRERSFFEWLKALRRQEGRGVRVNYGLHPRLGKYHQTACQNCQSLQSADEAGRCPQCGFKRVVRGVSDRIEQLADQPPGVHPDHRPPYVEQVPLDFIPGLGPKGREKLYRTFGTEMVILHRTSETDLAQVVGEKTARTIVLAREGVLSMKAGRAGVYGRIELS